MPNVYDCNPFLGQRRDDTSVPNMKRYSIKKIGAGYGGFYKSPQGNDLECIDYNEAL